MIGRMFREKIIALTLVAFVVIMTSACGAPPAPIQTLAMPTRPIAIAPTPNREPNTQDLGLAVRVIIFAREERVEAGKNVNIVAQFEPNNVRVTRRSDGTVLSISTTPQRNTPIAEMRWCYTLDAGCALTGIWTPFASEKIFEIETDWIGARELRLGAQFRDANGAIIPVLTSSSNGLPQETAQAVARITTVLNERTPLAAHPAKIQTLVAATRVSFPVTGFVKIEDGRCCAGGKAGSTVQVKVEFGATSPLGEVKEMRVRDFRSRKCASETEMSEAAWEPFAAQRTYRISGIPINWSSFDVSAQFRDVKGNLSPVYCSDLAVEGMP